MPRASISGLAVMMEVAGSILLWSGIKNRSVEETLRALLRGQPVESGPSQYQPGVAGPGKTTPFKGGGPAPPGGTEFGRHVANTALAYLGVPYLWGGETPVGWDCSGMVTYILHTVHGISLPDNNHTLAAQFYVWRGARTVLRSQCSPGDLVCWPTHIGIAISRDELVHAPGLGQQTRRQKIWAGAVIRRPLDYGQG